MLETECEHLRKLNAELKHKKTEEFDSRSLFPHVFRHDSMPMYVVNFFINVLFSQQSKSKQSVFLAIVVSTRLISVAITSKSNISLQQIKIFISSLEKFYKFEGKIKFCPSGVC